MLSAQQLPAELTALLIRDGWTPPVVAQPNGHKVKGKQKTEPVGRRIYRLRMELGLSQRELSQPGVSYAYISRIEAGARTPSTKALRKLAPKLGVTVAYLEHGEDAHCPHCGGLLNS